MKIFLIISLLMSQAIFAKESAKNKSKDLSLRTEMNHISKKIREIAPIIASEAEFVKLSNKDKILKNVFDLQHSFKELKKHPTIELQGLAINQLIMSEELKDVINLIEKGKPVMGRAKLLSTLNLCVSCHSQSPGMESNKLFSDSEINSYKISNFEKAELYFVTRDYEKANNLYTEFLNNSKKTDDDEMILKALERELIYFVKIKKDFVLAKTYFENQMKINKFSDTVLHELKDWSKMLSEKPLWENFDPKLVKEEEMDKFLKKFISDDEEGPIFTSTDSSEVFDLNLSSILLDYYNAHPDTKIGGKILYWLAILDKRISDDFFFSLGDFYLLACMEKYSKDPIAKECYENYIEDMQINLVTKETTKDKAKSKASAAELELKLKLNRLKKLIDYKEDEE
jgi:hypothetical protein